MAQPGLPESQPTRRRLDVPQDLQETAGRIGLTELTPNEIRVRFNDIVDRVKLGLTRRGKPHIVTEGPEAGMASDGGFAALESGVRLPSADDWKRVPIGREAYVASIGGTNSEYYILQKLSDTEITKKKFGRRSYDEHSDKPMTFTEFVGTIVDPIAEDYKSKKGSKAKMRIGVSLAFPHENVASPDGVDAVFLPEKNGKLAKGWRITDWEQLPPEKRGFIGAMKERLLSQGIDTDDVELVLHDPTDKSKMGILNDTLGTLMDSKAAHQARNEGLKVLAMGGVGGTGTNLAVDQNGLVNLEFGRYPLPLDAEGKADPITERALDIIYAESQVADEPETPRGKSEMETETGGMYMPYRLRAGIQLLGEEGVLPNAHGLEAWVKKESASNPAFISDLALIEGYGNDALKFMARGMLHRAGQNFGLSVAAVANVLYGNRSQEAPAALLVEGSFVNHAAEVKRTAEAYAHLQGQPIEIYEANSVDGIGALAMSL